MKTLLKVEEVAVLIGVSTQTINNWYVFKRMEPENELAQMLPDYVQEGPRKTRYWEKADIQKFINFKRSMPRGCSGAMGKATQRYVKYGQHYYKKDEQE